MATVMTVSAASSSQVTATMPRRDVPAVPPAGDYVITSQVRLVNTHTHTHTRLTALCPGLPGWAGTRKVIPIWILLKQETVSGSGISWAICKSAPRSRQITIPVLHHSKFFTGRMPFLPPNQQRQSTEGKQVRLVNTWKCAFCHQNKLWYILLME